jgi:parallel beta-helix repeat protein
MESAIRLDGTYIIVTENDITNTRKSVINRAFAINGENLLNSTISKNNICGNGDSVYLQNISGTHFSDNYLADNGGPVLYVLVADNCYFSGNNIVNSLDCGIKARGCNNSLFSENEIKNNSLGIMLELSYHNKFHRNNLINNTQQVYATDSANYWDDGYPSGGNYWSDYAGSDLYGGPFQNETGSDGLGDVPYFMDDCNQDNYPIMSPMQSPQGDINGDSTVDIFDCVIVALAFSSIPNDPNWNAIADINSDGIVDIFDLVVVALHFGETD